ncbi:3-5 exonuclease, (ISS), partial [Sigmodon hispidus]
GTTIGDIFDPTAIRNKQLLSNHIFKFICIKLGEAPFLLDVDLLEARELEFGSAKSLNHMFLILQLGADEHDDLANVNSGHCALGLPKGSTHTCLEPVSSSTVQHLVDSDDIRSLTRI